MFDPGRGYNFTTNGEVTTLDIPGEWPLPADPDQFQVSVFKSDEGWGVQCRKGFVRSPVYGKNNPWTVNLSQFEIRKFFSYPTGSKTTGDAATVADTSLVDLGGHITINPASVEGGSDNWGVYIIGCPPDDDVGLFVPYLAIMADGSDADAKTEPFLASQTIKYYQFYMLELIDVTTPTGTTTITNLVFNGQGIYNYNCQKWKVADLSWDGTEFQVTQTHLGPMALVSPVSFEGFQYVDPASPPPWFPTPYYLTELQDWNGAWSGYDKDPTNATVEV